MYPPGFVQRLRAAKLAVEAAKTTDAWRYARLAATIKGALPDSQNKNLRWILPDHAGPAAPAAAEGKPRFAPALILYLLYWCQKQAFAMIRQVTGPRGQTLAPAASLYDEVDIEGPIRRHAEQVFERFVQHCIAGSDVGEDTDIDPWARGMAYGPGSLLDKQRRFVDKVCTPFAAVLGFPAGVTMTSSPLAARA